MSTSVSHHLVLKGDGNGLITKSTHPYECQCSLHLLHLPCDEFSAFSDLDPDVLLGDPLWSYEEDHSKPSKDASISL